MSEEVKATPGPWEVLWPDVDEQWSIYHDDREAHDPNAYITGHNSSWSKFASVVVMVHGDPDAEGRANANLIGAAPDLLAALIRLVEVVTASDIADHMPVNPESLRSVQAARLAIAKATTTPQAEQPQP